MHNVYNTVNLTKDNHLQYWFNHTHSQHFRTHPYEVAHMKIGGKVDTSIPFVDSLMETANEFHRRHGDEFRVFLSGGLDSELACRVFLKANLKFQPVLIRFKDDLNAPDVHNALKFCNDAGLKPLILEFDPYEFVNSNEWCRIARDYQCYTFYQQMLISIAEQQAQPMITIDEIELTKDHHEWVFSKKEDQDGCWHRFVEKTGIPAYNNFYTYDLSTMVAFLKLPRVVSLVNNEIFGKLSWNSSKNAIYQELTNFNMRPRHKRHGMEHLMHVWDHVEEHIAANVLFDDPVVFAIPVSVITNALASGQEVIWDTI